MSSAAALAALVALAPAAAAHELRPGLLRVEVAEGGAVELRLRLPPRPPGAPAEPLAPALGGCALAPAADPDAGADVQVWRGTCGATGPTGALELRGLAAAGHDVVVDLRRGDGPAVSGLLRPNAPRLELGPAARPAPGGYLVLGAWHILGGLDHLLFVVGLVVLVGRRAPSPRRAALRSAAALTGFTVAHSLTLAAATLGLVAIDSAPVEACIALSLILLGRSLAADAPPASLWGFAAACGLLHGLGFAGALREIGLPDEAIAPALLAFNGGVELAQIAVAAALLGLLALLPAGRRAAAAVPVVVGAAIGAVAVAMLLDRLLLVGRP